MTPLLIALTALCFLAAHWLLLPDSQTRRWYTDRACLFTSGMCVGIGLVGIGFVIYLVTA